MHLWLPFHIHCHDKYFSVSWLPIIRCLKVQNQYILGSIQMGLNFYPLRYPMSFVWILYPFTFRVIIDIYEFRAIVLPVKSVFLEIFFCSFLVFVVLVFPTQGVPFNISCSAVSWTPLFFVFLGNSLSLLLFRMITLLDKSVLGCIVFPFSTLNISSLSLCPAKFLWRGLRQTLFSFWFRDFFTLLL